ncbi:MAG TPA: chorismate mutase [Gemmatimonadaceae bacterium]|nr:chorismate mutase [Gemmatimonadaceae bacterium]
MHRRLAEVLTIMVILGVSELSMAAIGTARARSVADGLRPLVETSARRLAIAEAVALSKWDSRTAVEDTLREAQVLARAVADGTARGLDQRAVTNFFRAQIEANKLVQYTLLSAWQRRGGPPPHGSIDLATTIRPQLDHVETELMTELVNTAAIRASADCPVGVAKAVTAHLAAHQYDLGPLEVIALDRALAATCTL